MGREIWTDRTDTNMMLVAAVTMRLTHVSAMTARFTVRKVVAVIVAVIAMAKASVMMHQPMMTSVYAHVAVWTATYRMMTVVVVVMTIMIIIIMSKKAMTVTKATMIRMYVSGFAVM